MPSLADYDAPYPAAAPGQERKVIYLPSMDPDVEQNHMRVQLIPGRHEDCEDGRLYHLTGTISEGEVEGWGYSYYVVTLGDIYAAHRTPSDKENATTFVAMYENPMLTYNSKLPIVVYVPEGAEVRYRIWMDEVGRTAEPLPNAAAAAPAPYAARNDAEKPDAGRHRHSGKEREYPAEKKAPVQRQQKSYPEPAAARGIPSDLQAYEEHNEDARPLRAGEAERHHGIPELPREGKKALAQHEYVEETKTDPVLRASEKAATRGNAPREMPVREARESEAQPEKRHSERKGEPNSEQRRRSQSKPYKQSSPEAGAPKRSERGLSATELSPAEENTHKSATERSPSTHNKRQNVDKSHNESSNSGRPVSTASSKDKEKNEDKDGGYERKAKNFWNRARGNSKSKEPSPKKGGKVDQWSEM